jgi:predicted nucleic acid-binding protein
MAMVLSRPFVFDTTCLIKLVIPEPGEGTGRVRRLISPPDSYARPVHLSPLAISESLGVLKRKLLAKAGSSDKLSREDYEAAVELLLTYTEDFTVVDVQVDVRSVLRDARAGKLDYGDALHFALLAESFLASLQGPSAPCLATCDRGLAQFARGRGVLVWNPDDEEPPPLVERNRKPRLR